MYKVIIKGDIATLLIFKPGKIFSCAQISGMGKSRRNYKVPEALTFSFSKRGKNIQSVPLMLIESIILDAVKNQYNDVVAFLLESKAYELDFSSSDIMHVFGKSLNPRILDYHISDKLELTLGF